MYNDPSGNCVNCVNNLSVIKSTPHLPIQATGIYDSDRVDKDIPENAAFLARELSLGMAAGVIGPNLALRAVTACLGNMPGCRNVVGDLILGEAATIPVVPTSLMAAVRRSFPVGVYIEKYGDDLAREAYATAFRGGVNKIGWMSESEIMALESMGISTDPPALS